MKIVGFVGPVLETVFVLFHFPSNFFSMHAPTTGFQEVWHPDFYFKIPKPKWEALIGCISDVWGLVTIAGLQMVIQGYYDCVGPASSLIYIFIWGFLRVSTAQKGSFERHAGPRVVAVLVVAILVSVHIVRRARAMEGKTETAPSGTPTPEQNLMRSRRIQVAREGLLLFISHTVLAFGIPRVFAFEVFPKFQRQWGMFMQAILLFLFFSLYWPAIQQFLFWQLARITMKDRKDLGFTSAKRRAYITLNRFQWQHGNIDMLRTFYGRAVLAQCSSTLFFLVISKDIFMALWHFGVRYVDSSTLLAFQLFHPDEAARVGW